MASQHLQLLFSSTFGVQCTGPVSTPVQRPQLIRRKMSFLVTIQIWLGNMAASMNQKSDLMYFKFIKYKLRVGLVYIHSGDRFIGNSKNTSVSWTMCRHTIFICTDCFLLNNLKENEPLTASQISFKLVYITAKDLRIHCQYML